MLPWRRDELVVIASPDHELAQRRRIAPSSLQHAPFIVRERGSGTRRVAEEALRAHGISLRIALTLSSTEAIKQAVAAGNGLAIVSKAAIGDQLALGRIAVVQLRGLSFPRALSELDLVGRAPSAAAQGFRLVLHARRETATAPPHVAP